MTMQMNLKKYYVEWQKPDTKQYILCGSISVSFLKGKTNLCDRNQC